jgi:hypothetical protein
MNDDERAEIDRGFEEHIAPLRDSLDRLLDLTEATAERWGQMPSAESPAMREIANEAPYNGPEPWGDQPVQSTFNTAGLQIAGAIDCARAIITLLRADRTPIFSHTVLARACLEHAGLVWLLLEPAIGVERRIARGMNERLFALHQQKRLPLDEEEQGEKRTRREALLDIGAGLGLDRVKGRNGEMLAEQRPSQTEVIRRLFTLPDEPKGLGEAVYGLYSAVAHGTSFGLTDSVTMDAPDLPTTPGVTWGAIYTSSGQVVSVLCAVTLGLGQSIDRRFKLYGWENPDWSGAFLEAIHIAGRSLPRSEPEGDR